MLLAALCAFAAGAVAGIFLALRHFRRKRLPVGVALLHGLGGATGFTLLLLTVVREPNFVPARQALYLFIATIALGCVNLLFHIRKVRHRTSLIVMHALTAVSGVGTLIYALFVHGAPAAPPAAPSVAPPLPAPAPVASAAPPVVPAPAASAAPVASAAAPATPPKFEIEPSVARALSQSVGFDTRSSELLPASRATLRSVAGVLKQHPEIALIEVQGHADPRGDEAANLELTRGRAAAVVEALAAEGVARERLSSAGYAARCPVDPACRQDVAPERCNDPARWQRDRRVVFLPLRVGEASYHGEVVCSRAVDLIPPEHVQFHAAGGPG